MGQVVEHHPRLHRGERIDVLHGPPVAYEAIHGRLIHPSQREVGRRAAPGVGARAMPDDVAERRDKLRRQLMDRAGVVQALGVEPVEGQAAVLDPAHDVERVRPGRCRVRCQLQLAPPPFKLEVRPTHVG